jgi:hypothetical protein
MPHFLRSACFLAFTFLLCTSGRAQQTFTGMLRDSLTNEPVAFATVYIDGTSKGDVTTDDGTFTLYNVQLPATLVVSHLNYVTLNMGLNPALGPLELRLTSRQEVLASVEVNGANGRAKNLAEFRRLLLGTGEWADKSELVNDKVLRFDRDYASQTVKVFKAGMRSMLRNRQQPSATWNRDSSEYTFDKALNLKVTTRGPLEVRLPHLGYVLRADYESFLSDYASARTMYLCTNFFQAVKKVTRQHLRNRARAYRGSTMHFTRALVADSMVDNGFRVFEVVKDSYGAEQKVEYDLRQHLSKLDGPGHVLKGLRGREFVVFYYAAANFKPLPKEKWRRAQPVQSRIYVDADRCLIYPGGVFGDAFLAFAGDMGMRGLAGTLPQDYVYPAD